ncbi:MAG: sialate O-acetylesterase [Opitutales bacterium]|nr:sialate O-acetylesterase [Opitutales bacterium]
MHIKIVKLFVLSLAMFVCDCFAELRMPRIFSNSMILQREEKVNIWGWADANAKVDVEFAGQKVSAIADKNGRWKLSLNPMKASTQGREMRIFENGVLGKTIKNILVGEVWIAGGQSNMAFGLTGVKDSKEIIANANNSLIRYFDQGYQPPMNSINGLGKDSLDDVQKGCRWLVCSPTNAQYSFKAVPYIFAREVAKKLNVPVAIIYTAIPGTTMTAWIPRNDFEKNPAFEVPKKNFERRLKAYDYQKELAKFEEKVRTYPARVAKAKAEGKKIPPAWTVAKEMRPWKDSPDKRTSPVLLYNIRIYPIKDFTARGIIWYQGESDSQFVDAFQTYFKGFIEVWRKEFNKPDMPFLFVELPSYSGKTWHKIRLKQQAVADSTKNVYMATTTDTGEKNDIHPNDKLPVAERLAKLALANVYKFKDVRANAPKLSSVSYNENSAVVKFNTDGRLAFKGKPRGFEICVDGNWITPATAEIQGKSVVLVAPEKSAKISGVRYLYTPWAKPLVSLYDETGLPAYSFFNKTKRGK